LARIVAKNKASIQEILKEDSNSINEEETHQPTVPDELPSSQASSFRARREQNVVPNVPIKTGISIKQEPREEMLRGVAENNQMEGMLVGTDLKGCVVWLDPLKDYQAVKERAIITRVTVPNDYLPFCMENFEALDSQGPAEKPKQKKPIRPKLTSKPLKAKKRPSQRART
jgi:hypothetical protein